MKIEVRPTAIGKIAIAEHGGALTGLFFDNEAFPGGYEQGGTPLLHEAFSQLDAWLSGQIRAFSLPLAPDGTVSMRRVWDALSAIPYGGTISYGSIAASVGSPGAARFVGTACRSNPLPIFIPCHRVVPRAGGAGGYRGGLDLKRQLLEFESRNCALFDVQPVQQAENRW
ncbi:MAG: methylated-DNA--[protein]-cysteine S-methyltransferase [Chlorobiaceae bacterium]|nr:methylated-DNA--[protein]-cysteine S-methyltransferase [Chlorobiaceae bacterium]